ncbi:hypothetical protein AAHB53_23565 [Niallia circulans]
MPIVSSSLDGFSDVLFSGLAVLVVAVFSQAAVIKTKTSMKDSVHIFSSSSS